MTLQELLTLTTIEHRHLLLAYLLVAVVQVGYLVWTLRGLFRPSTTADAQNASPSSSHPHA